MAHVSLTRVSLPRFTLTRSQFGAFHFGAMPVWHVSLWRVSHFCAYADPVSAKASFAPTIFRISAYLFALMFPFCDEVFSTPVWHVSRFASMLIEYASMACSTHSISICGHVSFLQRSVFYARISFLRIFPLCVVHHLFINLVNVSSRLHHSGLVY